MNNKISDMQPADQASRSPESVKPGQFEGKPVRADQGVPRVAADAPSVEGKPLADRKAQVAETESRHSLTVTDKTYKAIVRNLGRYNPNNRAFYIFAMKQIGIQPGQPLPNDFPKRLMQYTDLTPKEKRIILKRLEGDLRLKWSTQTLKGELNAYQKQLDKEHGIDPAAIKDSKLKTYREKLAKEEFNMRLLFLMIEYANQSDACAKAIEGNITTITDVFDISFTAIAELNLNDIVQEIFSSSDKLPLLASVLEKATEIYQMTQKTAQYTPIMAQRALVTPEKINAILRLLIEKGQGDPSEYHGTLLSLGIEEGKPLPDDLTSRLYKTELHTVDKQIIIKTFENELSAKMSVEAAFHKINVHDRTLQTNPEAVATQDFRTQLAKSHFEENLAAILMKNNISFDPVSLDQYEDLKSSTSVVDVFTRLKDKKVSEDNLRIIAGDVWDILQNSKKIEENKQTQFNEVKKNELKKVFSDPAILKILSFLQTDQTAADRKVIHYEGVKASPEVIDELISSPEFTEFMTGFESVIFTDDIKAEFELQVGILSDADVSSKDRKNAEKVLQGLEEKMIKNVSKHFNTIGDKLQINASFTAEETNTAQKLTALLNVADGKKIATKDMATIIKHRIIFGIKLATLSLFAAAAVSVVIIGLIHVFLPALAAMTVAIIVTAVMVSFGVVGFNVGAFGSDDLREKYEKFMTHLKEMGTNMNVRQSEAMATPLFTKFV